MSEATRPSLMRRIGPVLLTVMLDLLGFGLVIPLLSFYAEDFHATPLQVTMLVASYSVAQFLFGPLWGMLSDRFGRRPVLLATIAGCALSLLGFGLGTSLWQLFFFRTLHGVFAANIGTAQAAVADVTTGDERAAGMGMIGAAFGIGFSVGPWLGGELSTYGLAVPILAAAALSAVNWLWVLVGFPETRHPDSTHKPRPISPAAMLAGLAHPVVGMCIGLTFVATVAFAMMESTFALVGEHVWGYNARDVGQLFGLIGLVAIVVQGGLIRPLVKRVGEPTLIPIGYAFIALGLGGLSIAPGGWWIPVGCVVMTIGTSITNPSLTSLISRGTNEEEQGRILGVNQSFSALGRAIAPTIGGLLYTHWTPTGAIAAGAILSVGALLWAIPATRRAAAR